MKNTHLCVCVQLLSFVWPCHLIWLYSPPRSSVHRIFQARTQEWVAIFLFMGSSLPRVEPATLVSLALAGGFITTSATCEAHSPLKDHLYSAGHITKVRIDKLLNQVHSLMFISLNSVGKLVNCNAMGVLNCKQYTLWTVPANKSSPYLCQESESN